MGALGEPMAGAMPTDSNLFRQSAPNSSNLYPTMLTYRLPLRQTNSTGTGSLEEMNRRSCSTDSTSRNSMILLQQIASGNLDCSENGSRLEDFIRNIKCSGYGKKKDEEKKEEGAAAETATEVKAEEAGQGDAAKSVEVEAVVAKTEEAQKPEETKEEKKVEEVAAEKPAEKVEETSVATEKPEEPAQVDEKTEETIENVVEKITETLSKVEVNDVLEQVSETIESVKTVNKETIEVISSAAEVLTNGETNGHHEVEVAE